MPTGPTDAWDILAGKVSVPSEMRTREWQRVPQWLRERQFYMAAVHRAEILEVFRTNIAGQAAGAQSEEESIRNIRAFLDNSNYRPEPGQEGTIKDLSNIRRILISLRMNQRLLQGYGQKMRGLDPDVIRAFPAWELVRAGSPKAPRNWIARFQKVGGILREGRIIALKQDLVWAELGSVDNFPDATGVDYTPLAWGSWMRLKPVPFRECKRLGMLKGWKPPTQRVLSSPNEALETTPRVQTPELREALTKSLGGLAEWRDDVLVFTDPNGTRPYPPSKLAEVVTAKLPADLPSLQAEAVKEFVADALNVRLKRGSDLVDDFVRFAQRTQPLAAATPIFRGEQFARAADLEARLRELLGDGSAVRMVAESWSMIAEVAEKFASRGKLPYQLVLTCRKHSSIRPIYPTVKKVMPRYWKQAEAVALEGVRFRVVGSPEFDSTQTGRVVVRVNVEEVAQ